LLFAIADMIVGAVLVCVFIHIWASNCKSYTIPDGDWNVVNFIFSYISPHKFI
jgi:hypothetical protein